MAFVSALCTYGPPYASQPETWYFCYGLCVSMDLCSMHLVINFTVRFDLEVVHTIHTGPKTYYVGIYQLCLVFLMRRCEPVSHTSNEEQPGIYIVYS